MNLGFIGTGKIASSVITGICKSNISYKQIIISPRNKKIARNLKKKFKRIIIAKDNQEFKIGEISIIVLHTPGHTMESTTYLLRDSYNKDIAIFTGDTLFLGDVGRPDLAQKAINMTQEELDFKPS